MANKAMQLVDSIVYDTLKLNLLKVSISSRWTGSINSFYEDRSYVYFLY